VRLPDVKGKILLAPCQQNLLSCEVKIAQTPKKQKQNICWKQIRTFQRRSSAITLNARF